MVGVYEDPVKCGSVVVHLGEGRRKEEQTMWLAFGLGFFAGLVSGIFGLLWWVMCCG